MKPRKKATVAVLAAALALMVAPQAVFAGGTRAGTQVDNTALVSWNAGSVAYTTSDIASFVVDELINLQVTNNGATALTVLPGDTNQPLAFDVQNWGNSTIDIRVAAVTDDLSLFVDAVELWADDGIAGFNSTLDDDLNSASYDTVSISTDTIYTFYIVADIPAAATTVNTPDTYHLLVTAIEGGIGGTPMGPDNEAAFDGTTVQQIMADAGGTFTGDDDYDGQDSASATYNLVWADLTLTKSFAVIDTDPMNAGQHAIPGATVRYTLTVSNTGTAAATGISITDTAPDGTEWGGVISFETGTTVDSENPLEWNIPSLPGGDTAELVFEVTISGP